MTISLSTLWHQFLRNSFIQVNPDLVKIKPIPLEQIYTKALLNTLLIAITYLPIRFHLEYLNIKTKENITIEQASINIPWTNLVKEFKTIIPILSPILCAESH